MQYVWLVIVLLAAFHAYTYARWLKQQGNRIGMIGVYILILIGLALPGYRIFKDSF